jgi:hypothetical protein
MNQSRKADRARPGYHWLFVAWLLLPGCWWQRDAYTARLISQKARFEKEAEYERLLGPPFEGTAEFPMWIRPPKTTQLRALPAGAEGVLLGLFQGDAGATMVEFIIIGSVGNETLSEFEQKAFADLNKTGKGPGVELKRQEAVVVPCMHGGDTNFDLFSIGAARQLTTGGAPTTCQWLCYFAEEQTQKIMLAFIIPDSIYKEFGEGAMTKCLESLALSSKVSAARSGVSAGVPSAAPTGGATSF